MTGIDLLKNAFRNFWTTRSKSEGGGRTERGRTWISAVSCPDESQRQHFTQTEGSQGGDKLWDHCSLMIKFQCATQMLFTVILAFIANAKTTGAPDSTLPCLLLLMEQKVLRAEGADFTDSTDWFVHQPTDWCSFRSIQHSKGILPPGLSQTLATGS